MKLLGSGSKETFLNCKFEDLTLLHHVVFDENMEVLKQLRENLKFFEEIVDDTSNEEGWTPLAFAAQKANLEMVKFLIEHGASPVKGKANGMNAFHFAAINNDVRMLDFVIQRKGVFSVDMKNNEGWTPA